MSRRHQRVISKGVSPAWARGLSLKQARYLVSILARTSAANYLVPVVDSALAKDAILVHTILEVFLYLNGVVLQMSTFEVGAQEMVIVMISRPTASLLHRH
jgi:hypothetical protein